MKLNSEDIQLLQRANAKLHEAEAILRFLSDHFRDKYNLTPGDHISELGEIQSSQPSMFGNLENSNGTTNSPDGTLSGANSRSLQER